MREIADAIIGRLGSEQKRVATDIPDDLPHVQLDPRLLELVVENVVDNALKF